MTHLPHLTLPAAGELDEDLAALRAYRATRNEESLPESVVDRILGGESPVRVFREHRAMSLEDLAAATDTPVGRLQAIEDGSLPPHTKELIAAARALDVDLEDLA